MSPDRRLSICYVAPGQGLLSSSGPSRNVLNLARALSRWAEVTVAFHRLADQAAPSEMRVLEIHPSVAATTIDDAAMRGVGYGDFISFMRRLHDFVSHDLQPFDVVLEKSWLLSGYVSALCRRRGQLGVPIENIVPNVQHAAQQSLTKLLRLHVGRWIAGRNLRRAPLIIAETEFLKREIAGYWRVQPDRISVVDLGVDRALFHPLDGSAARGKLGMPADSTILLYVGALDRTHNLEPVITAMRDMPAKPVTLHVVGDGPRRTEYQNIAAAAGPAVVFHGRVPHDKVPEYIAAADLCLAP
jgi:glycosyltransferase involved in cell wall biosynthesis